MKQQAKKFLTRHWFTILMAAAVIFMVLQQRSQIQATNQREKLELQRQLDSLGLEFTEYVTAVENELDTIAKIKDRLKTYEHELQIYKGKTWRIEKSIRSLRDSQRTNAELDSITDTIKFE